LLRERRLGRTILPFGRVGKGKVALYGSLLEQVKETPNEAGVRVRL
jgi:hypothetical protein